MPFYTMIGGVNGTGKSSLTGILKYNDPDMGIIIDTDQTDVISDCLNKGISFTRETTLSGVRSLRTAQLAREKGYTVRLFYVGLDTADECVERIRNRVKHGGHDIPEADVRRRFEKRFDDILRILPLCREAEFYDNRNGFVCAALYRDGGLFFNAENVPDWLTELKNRL